MNPRAPQQPSMPPHMEPDRPNPWGGGGPPANAAAVVPAVPAPAPAPTAEGVLDLQCPHCRAGLQLRREHIGIDGACIHCSTPIRAVAYPTGQVAIELIQPTVSEIPSEVKEVETIHEVTVDLHPSVPVSEPHQQVAQEAAPSLWQTPPASEPIVEAVPAPEPAPEPVSLQPHTPPPVQGNPASMLQTGSALPQPVPQAQPIQSAPAPQPAEAPAFPSPDGAMPWTNTEPPPPVAERENFDAFEAATPFGATPPPEPEAQPIVVDPATAKPVSHKKLGKTKRGPNLRWLGWVAALIILAGLGFVGYTFAPKEKVDKAKIWVREFVKPAVQVFTGEGKVAHPSPKPDKPDASRPKPPAPSATTPPAAVPTATPADSTTPPTAKNKPAKPRDTISENLRVDVAGSTAIRNFYNAQTMAERLPYLLNPEQNRLAYEAYASRSESLPQLESVLLRKATLDSETGRWFGIFEVAEKGNQKFHRWIAIEDENGEFKLDWSLYEQLIDDALPRFLEDPTAAPREFRLAIKKGSKLPQRNNPWESEAIGLLIQSPFESQAMSPIALKMTDFEALGFVGKINGSAPKIAHVEMAWIPSEYDANSRVPIITRLIGWGAW